MADDPDRHHRRSIRLPGYDYAQAGAYFVTVCVHHRRCIFGDVVDDIVQLNDVGDMVHRIGMELSDHYPGVETDAFVVMPNHVHAIIVLTGPAVVGAGPRACPEAEQSQEIGQPQGVAPTEVIRSLSLADVVHRFKTLTTNRYIDGVRQRGWSPFAGRLWQRNYYEHVIRNETVLNRIREYIRTNPTSWTQDKENPRFPHAGDE